MSRALLTGAAAGVIAVVVFAAVHQLIISDIWFSLIPMAIVGALCGVALAWSYGVLVDRPSAGSWLAYIALHMTLLIGLGAASIAVYEPIIPMAALLGAGEPPGELIARALPLSVGFAVASAAFIAALWRRTLAAFAAALVVTSTLTFLFGLNISVLGLVAFSRAGAAVVAEFFALIALIMVTYAGSYLAIERLLAHRTMAKAALRTVAGD